MRAIYMSLLASGATASITTSFWFPVNLVGTDRITYVASVIGAASDRITLAAHPTNDPDYEALGIDTTGTLTLTVASTLFEQSVPEMTGIAGGNPKDFGQSYRCEVPSADATAAACTGSVGQGIARLQHCATPRSARQAETVTKEWTFSDPGTQGVETIVRTFPPSPTTPVPDWCSAISDLTGGSVPSSVLTTTAEVPVSEFTTFTFILTAGEEKLVPATTAGAPTSSTPVPTGSAPNSGRTGTSSSTAGTGAAAPMKTVAPALAALGAAVAGFL
ncbi:uncharacterized protein EI97DRAFT_436483 [Westerdykella ornata]|uniref:Uncharacterized protein n=1 Tax=Westerdykella ornata TaxID=318751 RepID=A0A6A6JCZ3_WESOR|nr:uncharacterized protein EI97DRAFT_436483 [Westerdykella ornata]KAF2273059.1 hypothetical protein EI97DRAFT_436483 [Westerdykella ornata]